MKERPPVRGGSYKSARRVAGFRPQSVFAVGALVCLTLAASVAMHGQQAPAAAPTAQSGIPAQTPHLSSGVLRAQSQIVRIDVEVTDSKGRPVIGLRPDEFTITDNGKIEKISAFSYADIERMETAGPESSQPIVVAVDNAGPNVRPAEQEAISNQIHDRRLIVLFFDLSTMATDDILRAHRAADKFVTQQMTAADLVAVVTFGTRLSIVMNFTNDRAALDKAIGAIVPGAPSQLANPLYAPAQNGEYDVQQDTGAAYTADETEFNVFNTDQKLEAIENLAEVLAGIPGRKALVEFTGGITQTGEDNRAELRAATDAANRADVSIYSIDARGLFATAPGGDATATAATGNSMFSGAAVFHQTEQRQDSRDTLATLSTDTGGRAFFDLGDLSDAFPKIERENSGYYLVGYTLPADVKRDGSWHSVRVKVNAPGVHVRYRNGYYAPRDFQHLEKEDRDQQLADAMNSEDPEVDLPVAVETGIFRIGDQQS
ncbi:MAG: VWA domain-containing protein, partial [Acidobacteriota bacterium]|nr:VWA domain-containing protein [Acidobacteriota bacterium]